jgi:predicted small secreted protein
MFCTEISQILFFLNQIIQRIFNFSTTYMKRVVINPPKSITQVILLLFLNKAVIKQGEITMNNKLFLLLPIIALAMALLLTGCPTTKVEGSGDSENKLPGNGSSIQPGTQWTLRSLPLNTNWKSICFGKGLFVAISFDNDVSAVSIDGINWTMGKLPSKTGWSSVSYGNDIFVAVANNDNLKSSAISSDGINWTKGTLPAIDLWQSVAFGNNLFIAITSGPNAASSSNGIDWTLQNKVDSIFSYSLAYGNNTFVAIVFGLPYTQTTSDGINWNRHSILPYANEMRSITYGNGIFMVVGKESLISSDGINWSGHNMPAPAFWRSVTYGKGFFVAVDGNATSYVASTSDGINWTNNTLPVSAKWISIAYGNNLFVAISEESSIAATSP